MEQLKQTWSAFWQQRSEQERTLLRWLGAIFVVALLYSILLDPALTGRPKLEKEIPELRAQLAEMQNLIREAQALGAQAQAAPATVKPMAKDSLEAALTQRGISVQSINLTSDFAKVQIAAAPFAALLAWLDEAQRLDRISVLEASITAQATPGLVSANLTLRQAAQ